MLNISDAQDRHLRIAGWLRDKGKYKNYKFNIRNISCWTIRLICQCTSMGYIHVYATMTRRNQPFSLFHSYIASQGREIKHHLTANHQSKDDVI